MKKINGGYYNNHVICPQIWYDLLYSWPSIHKFSLKYSHVYQSYSNFEFSKIQNGGRYSSQLTCLNFLYDSNNKKLLIHKMSCFYDNLNNLATNRSTNMGRSGSPGVACWTSIYWTVVSSLILLYCPRQPRWLSGLRRSLVHSLIIVRQCVLRNWDRIPVRAVRGLIYCGDIILICLLL